MGREAPSQHRPFKTEAIFMRIFPQMVKGFPSKTLSFSVLLVGELRRAWGVWGPVERESQPKAVIPAKASSALFHWLFTANAAAFDNWLLF